MTDTNDRLTEIAHRVASARLVCPEPWASEHNPEGADINFDSHHQITDSSGYLAAVTDYEAVRDLLMHAPADLAHLLSLAEQLQGQRDRAAARHGYETDMDGYRRCLTCRRPGGGSAFWPCDDATALGLDTEDIR